MTFIEWEGRAFDRFSGTITNPRFSGPFVKHLLADWKAEREKLLGRIKELEDSGKALWPHIHDEDMEGETDFEKAWMHFEAVLFFDDQVIDLLAEKEKGNGTDA